MTELLPHNETVRAYKALTPEQLTAVNRVLGLDRMKIDRAATVRILEFQRAINSDNKKTGEGGEIPCPETGILDPTTIAYVMDTFKGEQNPKRAMVKSFEAARDSHPHEIFVLDVSANRPGIDLALLKERCPNVKGVYVKATEGAHFTDPTALSYATEAARLGFAVGAYFWPWPVWEGKVVPLKPQVENFARFCNGQARELLTLPPMMDCEAMTPDGTFPDKSINRGWGNVSLTCAHVGAVKAFEMFHELLTLTDDALNTQTGIYGNLPGFRQLRLSTLEKAGWLARPVWLAHYESPTPRAPRAFPPKWRPRAWSMWQCSSKFAVPGYAKGCDASIVNQDMTTGAQIFVALAKAGLVQLPAAEPTPLSGQSPEAFPSLPTATATAERIIPSTSLVVVESQPKKGKRSAVPNLDGTPPKPGPLDG